MSFSQISTADLDVPQSSLLLHDTYRVEKSYHRLSNIVLALKVEDVRLFHGQCES